jgi:2-dehydro-3-deoxyphosphogluconate aldolase/(4S)-4-hydroxy-2-oxoglutarate aldolase
MSNQVWLSQLREHRAIAVIRTSQPKKGEQMALAVASAGIKLIEITWDSEGARELIPHLRSQLPNCIIGTGTIFSVLELQTAIAVGAEFLFTPHLAPEMIQAAQNKDIPIIPGALTPTEIVTAWNLGASCVKVFPVKSLGGVNYIQSLRRPMGQIPLIPTGGVTIANAGEFIQVGAIAVGLSGELFPTAWVNSGNWEAIAKQAKNLVVKLNLGKQPG